MSKEQSTIVVYEINGSTRRFPVPFEYLSRQFVVVTVLGTGRTVLTLGSDYRFVSLNEIETTVAYGGPDGNFLIEIRRVTSATDRLVEFSDGSVLRSRDMNVSAIQTIHIAEEARNLAADTLATDDDGNLDARGRRLVNLGDAVSPKDALTLDQVMGWSQSALNQANRSQAEADKSAASAAAALASQRAAKTSETNAKTSETNAKTSETNAKTSETNAKTSEDASLVSQNAAKTSETNAKDYELAAEGFAAEAEQSAQAAAQSAAQSDVVALRQDLANPNKGAAMVGYAGGTVADSLGSLSSAIAEMSGSTVTAAASETGTAEENTAALQSQAGSVAGMTITFPAGTFEFTSLTLAANTRITGQGSATVLKLADGAGGHLITSSGSLTLTDLVLDQNRQGNPDRMKSAISFSGPELYARNVKFRNTMFAGVHIPNVAVEKVTLLDCDFDSMAEHSGIMGEQTQAVNCRVTTPCKVVIRGGNVSHPLPADVDAAPGGFIFAGSGFPSVEVTGVTFTNIGQRKAANFIGAIDLYTNCRDVTVSGNKVFNYYYVPFKFQNCQRVTMTGNTVMGAADAAANQAVVFQNARDHQIPVVEFTCTGNVFVGTSQYTVGIYVQGDPDRIFDTERVTISGNVIRAFRYGINTSYVKNANMIGNDISLSVDGIYIRDIINGSTFSISGGRIANSSSRGIAATGAPSSQLNLTVSGVTIEASSSFHLDANYADRLTVSGCNLIGTPINDIRSQNNGMAVITGNNNGTVTERLSILVGTVKQAGNSWN